MQSVIVIPARFASVRFSGKPLALVSGKSVLHRTWSLAKAVPNIDAVYIATDDPRIEAHAFSFGAEVIRVDEACENGTERVFKALLKVKQCPEIIVNLQGDSLLTPPWVIQALVETMRSDQSVSFVTPAVQMTASQYRKRFLDREHDHRVRGTTVVFDREQYALYFSKSIIPCLRQIPQSNLSTERVPVYVHVGLYAYRYDMLNTYIQLPPTPLEQLEGLEQLRLLENRFPVKIVLVDYKGRTHCAIDHADDIQRVEAIIQQEGELLSVSTL